MAPNPELAWQRESAAEVHCVHERTLPVSAGEAGALIDGLSSPRDRLWPRDAWPSMHLTPDLRVGACGGHGPIRYEVEAYEPGRRVRFRFFAPRGLKGFHEFAVVPAGEECALRHVLEARLEGLTRLSWPLLYEPLHDALIEDALDRAESALGTGAGRRESWSYRVRVLRRLLGRPAIRRPR
ncbi:MAG: SRPBCC family protein [marine benthic group bacterium]|nr:SRPBCC family protein [Gemmatimonadota bacterium]